jgi:hypothetical protein
LANLDKSRSSIERTPERRSSGLTTRPSQKSGLATRPGETTQGATVDICFVFDTTGSMSNKIDGLMQCTIDLVRDLAQVELDWRVTTVPFGDLTVPGDRIVSDQAFVRTREAAEQQIRHMPRFSGGGNDGESSAEAVSAALAKDYRQRAVKVLVLLTDEPALFAAQVTSEGVARELRDAEVICFVASPDLQYYRSWATENGGEWFQIGSAMDTTSLLRLLKSLVRQVVSVAKDVHQLAGGSVRRYLELGAGDEHRALDE